MCEETEVRRQEAECPKISFPSHSHALSCGFTFSPSFVFINIPGVTFIFEEQKTGARSQESECPSTFAVLLQTSDLGLFPDTRHLAPSFHLPLFSSTSPESPSFLKGRSQKSGGRRQESGVRMSEHVRDSAFVLRTLDFSLSPDTSSPSFQLLLGIFRHRVFS